MTLKIIARTNEPRTCLWCGQKLRENKRWHEREVTREQWQTLSETDSGKRWWTDPTTGDVAGLPKPRKLRVVALYRRHDDTRIGETGQRFVIEVAVPNGTFGVVDGLFCTGRCAQDFGTAAARNGYRFQPTKGDSHD